MAINFPNNPIVGDTFTDTTSGFSFEWNGTVWKSAPISVSGGANVSISTTPPTTPSAGDLWYNSNNARTFIYYDDLDSSQWVDIAPFNYAETTITSLGGGGVSDWRDNSLF